MNDLITRLRRTKMILAGGILAVVGFLLIALDAGLGDESLTWRDVLPWSELGGILIGAALLGIWIDHYFKSEQTAATREQLSQQLREHTPLFRDSILQAFAADKEDLRRIATPETLDQIIANSLALRLDDDQFAEEVYADIRKQTVQIDERWSDASASIYLSPVPGREEYFAITVRWEYKVAPTHPVRRFACTSDRVEYAELAQSGGDLSTWFFKPDTTFSASDRAAFELLQFSVNGEDRPIRRSSRKHYQEYTVSLGDDIATDGEPVTISYTTQTITRRSGHVLFIEVQQPTKGLDVTFDYTGTDIATVSALDLMQSVRPSRIEHAPEQVPPETLRVEIDGWVFPRSGIAFVWTLESELAEPASR